MIKQAIQILETTQERINERVENLVNSSDHGSARCASEIISLHAIHQSINRSVDLIKSQQSDPYGMAN